jgi:hypothetical protein
MDPTEGQSKTGDEDRLEELEPEAAEAAGGPPSPTVRLASLNVNARTFQVDKVAGIIDKVSCSLREKSAHPSPLH